MSDWERYVPVAERRARAARKLLQLNKAGRTLAPIRIQGRTIARTFWGRAWCENLEAYSDYANRLPRGRTYARNGSILDLQIAEGRVTALVSGSTFYEVTVRIAPLDTGRWREIRQRCAGQIDSLVELLDGRLSRGVMEVVTRPGQGLFPDPLEIQLQCTCPDWAVLCKHVAATLYGVGARLDDQPQTLFSLRGVDPSEMIEDAIDHGVTGRKRARGRVLEVDDIASVFGVDIDFESAPSAPEPPPAETADEVDETDGLSEIALRTLAVISDNPALRTPQIAALVGASRASVTGAITRLKKRELVGFIGAPGTGGYYRFEEP